MDKVISNDSAFLECDKQMEQGNTIYYLNSGLLVWLTPEQVKQKNKLDFQVWNGNKEAEAEFSKLWDDVVKNQSFGRLDKFKTMYEAKNDLPF